MYSVQENYLDVVDLQYYLPVHTEPAAGPPSLPNGKVDIVRAGLYGPDDPQPASDGTEDPYKITTVNFPAENAGAHKNVTESIKVLAPEGFRLPFSLGAGDAARLSWR